MDWLRIVTFAASVISAGFAVAFPSMSFILAPIAAALLGYAKKHPSDVKELATVNCQLNAALIALQSSQRAQAVQPGKTDR